MTIQACLSGRGELLSSLLTKTKVVGLLFPRERQTRENRFERKGKIRAVYERVK
jgi:hypothetical protein